MKNMEVLLDTNIVLDSNDLEDYLQAECATKMNLDYIITRDPKGFTESQVPALSPEEFLQKIKTS